MRHLMTALAALCLLAPISARAQSVAFQKNVTQADGTVVQASQAVNASNPLPTSPPQSSVTGSVTPATIGTSSAQVLAAASRRLLSIDNESTTATIACAFGATAAINTAGSFTIAPGVTRLWKDYPVPADAVNCIASGASTPATIEAN